MSAWQKGGAPSRPRLQPVDQDEIRWMERRYKNLRFQFSASSFSAFIFPSFSFHISRTLFRSFPPNGTKMNVILPARMLKIDTAGTADAQYCVDEIKPQPVGLFRSSIFFVEIFPQQVEERTVHDRLGGIDVPKNKRTDLLDIVRLLPVLRIVTITFQIEPPVRLIHDTALLTIAWMRPAM